MPVETAITRGRADMADLPNWSAPLKTMPNKAGVSHQVASTLSASEERPKRQQKDDPAKSHGREENRRLFPCPIRSDRWTDIQGVVNPRTGNVAYYIKAIHVREISPLMINKAAKASSLEELVIRASRPHEKATMTTVTEQPDADKTLGV